MSMVRTLRTMQLIAAVLVVVSVAFWTSYVFFPNLPFSRLAMMLALLGASHSLVAALMLSLGRSAVKEVQTAQVGRIDTSG